MTFYHVFLPQRLTGRWTKNLGIKCGFELQNIGLFKPDDFSSNHMCHISLCIS